MNWKPLVVTIALICCHGAVPVRGPAADPPTPETAAVRDLVDGALALLIESPNRVAVDQAVLVLDAHWRPELIAPLLDIMSVPRSEYTRRRTVALLTGKTGRDFGFDLNDWYVWLWNQPAALPPGYAEFKADLFARIDPRFDAYFRGRQESARIRLDEIRWGGVRQDGIPPLREPDMIPADQAGYLDDSNIVFGLEINGDARAYPKRVLAWHEMFTDTVGGIAIAGVYCTLCGTVIPYKTAVNGINYTLGTSGFLYRSNKLMYDRATQSLWSTARGEPVVGPLAGRGIRLDHLSTVTTTWAEWRRRHPDTTVLSLDTGHRRDYAEGAAYRSYFSDDALMFNTPFKDDRLANKQEVLALVFPAAPHEQLAIDTDFLVDNPLYRDRVGRQNILVLTDTTGANRVYDPGEIDFVSYDRDSTLVDSNGRTWSMNEAALTSPALAVRLPRLPHRRAFWFGWHAAFPQTRLIR